jgi:hypothetical protein
MFYDDVTVLYKKTAHGFGQNKLRALLAWPTTAASPQITMEIHISDRTHKFQNKTGLNAKANSELYKSSQVNSA